MPLADMWLMTMREKAVTVIFFVSAACILLGFAVR